MAQSSPFFAPNRTAAPNRRGPIDLVHLAKQTLGDSGLECEVLRLFDQMSRTYFRRLQASTNDSDVRLNLHALKGAASGIGAWGIVSLAKAAEDDMLDGAHVNPERIDDLGMAMQEVSTFIGDLLNMEAI